MKRIETHDPDVMEWRGGGGCLALFGLPFLLAGLFIMSVPFTAVEMKGNMPKWMMVPFGAVFATIGAALVFGRRGVIVDRRRKEVRTWWGLLVALGGTERQLEEFTGVRLTREVRRSDKSSYTVYPVRLGGGGKPVSLGEPRDATAARKLGEELAKFVGLPLEDATSGSVVRREAGHLDESVRDRARRTGRKLEIPPPPPGMKTQVSFQGDATVLEIPPAGFHPAYLVIFAVVLIFPAIIGGFMIHPILGEKSEDPFRWVFVGFLSLFALVPVLIFAGVVLRAAKRRTKVTVSPGEVTVETSGIGLTLKVTLPADEIEELLVRDLPPQMAKFAAMKRGAGGIVLRTDRKGVSFGAHLSGDELRHLKGVIESVIAA